ncbi:MAG: helix-turn-helix domain-containing protein [Lachnospiraceae bacterium]|nr:helix-turn-helix domain-containing protein [Lachnospiraceae bacterium]
MDYSNIQIVKRYIQDDKLCRKNIGMKIKDFRQEKMMVNRDMLSRKIDYSFCTLTNVEIGRYYPKFDLLARLTKYGNYPIYFVLNQKCHIEPKYDDIRLLMDFSDEQKVKILLRLMCERNHLIHLYNEKIIDDICLTRETVNKDHVGYLIMLERVKQGISQKTLAEQLGVKVKKIKDIENGNSSIPFKKIYFISFLLNVPIDYFLMDCIESKQYIVNYLLTEVFDGLDDEERDFYIKYIELFRYKIQKKKKKY